MPKGAHVLQSLENVILIEVRLFWESFSSLLRKILPNGLFDSHSG